MRGGEEFVFVISNACNSGRHGLLLAELPHQLFRHRHNNAYQVPQQDRLWGRLAAVGHECGDSHNDNTDMYSKRHSDQRACEDVTSQSNQNPSEYVSTGVLSAPYHGAGVDRAKYFTTNNGNTVSSNIVTGPLAQR